MPKLTEESSTPAIRPVILSGGSGTRLWPLSRQHYPKQFAALLKQETLFATTLARVSDRTRYLPPLIVGNREHKFFILDALERLGVSDATILLEPQGRNTATAAIIAALTEAESGLLHLVMPSDHRIGDETAFHQAVNDASAAARSGHIVLFGINPDRPETGYGYIVTGESLENGGKVQAIARFTEKPDAEVAAALIQDGALWNSGIFLYSPSLLASEALTLAPEHFARCEAALTQAKPDWHCTALDAEVYAGMESHAFDTLIMERTNQGGVLACEMGWSDVGSWQALWQASDKDARHNAVTGPVIAMDVRNSYLRSEGPVLAVLGMEDCMVVATKDAVLVAPASRSQEVKGLLALVEAEHRELALHHTCVPRPWGTYETVAEGKNFLVKHIVVKPGRSLSLQMHHHRAEHWVVVAGTAKVECDGVEKLLFPNESVFVPRGATHRLTNPGKIDVQLIEVQSGDYLQEDDIVRFEDVYGRLPAKV